MTRTPDRWKRLYGAGTVFALLLAFVAAGVQPAAAGVGAPPTIDEVFNEAEGRLEFTINNPNPSEIGTIYGMAVAIGGQELYAETDNGWEYATLSNVDQWDQDMTSGTFNFGITWAQFFGRDIDSAFPFFEFGAGDVVLGYFVGFTAGQVPDEQNDFFNYALAVDSGSSLGGFYGNFAEFESSDVVLVGSLGSTTTQTQQGPTQISEPASLAIFGLGLIGLGVVRRRRRR
jgi:PEP-CTERM motif